MQQNVDVQHTHSKAMPNLILCCLGLTDLLLKFSPVHAYKAAQPWAKWLVSRLPNSVVLRLECPCRKRHEDLVKS